MTADPNPQKHRPSQSQSPSAEPATKRAGGARPAREVTNANSADVARFVTSIKGIEQQVGEHIIGALKYPNTMAVLTTVVIGPNGDQHLISAALSPERTEQINALLAEADEIYDEEETCMGFHCVVKPKQPNVIPDTESNHSS